MFFIFLQFYHFFQSFLANFYKDFYYYHYNNRAEKVNSYVKTALIAIDKSCEVVVFNIIKTDNPMDYPF